MDALRCARPRQARAHYDHVDPAHRTLLHRIAPHGGPAPRSDVVINELYYHPLEDDLAGEFIEIHNAGDHTVQLDGHRLRGGVRFDFPAGAAVDAVAALPSAVAIGPEPEVRVPDQ